MAVSPLDIEETLQLILAHIDNLQSLVECSLVNKTWWRLAIPFIWQGTEDKAPSYRYPFPFETPSLAVIQRLARAANPDRLRCYMRHIRYLKLSEEDADPLGLFESSHVDGDCSRVVTDPGLLLSPSLWEAVRPERLLISSTGSHRGLIHQIMMTVLSCRLKFLDFDSQRAQAKLSSKEFITVADKCPSLVGLAITEALKVSCGTMYDMLPLFPNLKIFEILQRTNSSPASYGSIDHGLRHANLVILHLEFSNHKTSHTLPASYLPNLRSLGLITILYTFYDAGLQVESLLRSVSNTLEHIDLQVTSPASDVLEALSTCTRLTDVQLRVRRSPYPDQHQDLASLIHFAKCCPQMQRLSFSNPDSSSNPESRSLDILELPRLLAHMPNLRDLRIEDAFNPYRYPSSELATRVFHRIAETCPQIQSLRLNWTLNLQTPWPTGAVFKELTDLHIDDMLPLRIDKRSVGRLISLPETDRPEVWDEITTMLGERMPRLSQLCQDGEWISEFGSAYLNQGGGRSERQWLEAPDPKPPGLPKYCGVKERIWAEIWDGDRPGDY